MEENKILNEEELSQIAGGDSKEDEERKRKELEMRGHLSFDAAGNYVFMDKHGTTGVFTPAQWDSLRKEWAYTGDPDWWMRTLDVGELQGKLG